MGMNKTKQKQIVFLLFWEIGSEGEEEGGGGRDSEGRQRGRKWQRGER